MDWKAVIIWIIAAPFIVVGAGTWIWWGYRALVTAWLNGNPSSHAHRQREGNRALADYGVGIWHDWSIPKDVDATLRKDIGAPD